MMNFVLMFVGSVSFRFFDTAEYFNGLQCRIFVMYHMICLNFNVSFDS